MNAKFLVALTGLALASFNPDALAATVYLCKSYAQKTFWSSGPCTQQQATMIEAVEVTSKGSLSEQVMEAEAIRQRRRSSAQSGLSGFEITPVPGSEKECQSQLKAIRELELKERQVPPPAPLDALRAERRIREERVSNLRCQFR